HDGDLERLARDARSICETHMDMFGQPIPIDRYLFLLTVMGNGYGGLEHRWSSSLIASRDELPRHGEKEPSEKYRRLLGLVSHEYFHLWNVKRIRPAAVASSNLLDEAYTRDLWIFEGVTSYYDDMALLRSGVIDRDSYFELLGITATIVWLGRGRFVQSLAESSYDAWVKLYKRDDNFPNTQVNYYTKGALAALGLDLLIRQRTDSRHSLDDVMRAVWQRHGVTDQPLEEGQFEAIVSEICATDFADYFDVVVRGVNDPPLIELLGHMGVRFETAPVLDGERKPMKRETGSPVPAALQVGFRNDNGHAVLTTVYTEGPAQKAGLASGDEIVAINGLRITATNFRDVVTRLRPGRVVDVDFFRRDELHQAQMTVEPAPDAAISIAIDDHADKDCQARRQLWLDGKTR
ncbi:MAG: M61 family metallopeptidase, partial [Gammaproteobacteria bacterium]|nr:M61 family metallopeptidase [Gammaproteobacteria bacterium]